MSIFTRRNLLTPSLPLPYIVKIEKFHPVLTAFLIVLSLVKAPSVDFNRNPVGCIWWSDGYAKVRVEEKEKQHFYFHFFFTHLCTCMVTVGPYASLFVCCLSATVRVFFLPIDSPEHSHEKCRMQNFACKNGQCDSHGLNKVVLVVFFFVFEV